MDFSAICVVILVLCYTVQDVESGNRRCPRIKIRNGRAKVRMRGRMVFFRCRRSFIRLGQRLAACVNGKWSHPAPVCIAPGCPDIPKRENLITQSTLSGALLKFTCEAGYEIQGPTQIYCNRAFWNKQPPLCISLIPLESCQFETEALCGWSQDESDNFDWTWGQGSTASGYTGPSSDHTFGPAGKGHYMFIETSAPRVYGDVARLISPAYPAEVISNRCFEFWLHMFGPIGEEFVGSLEVGVRKKGDDSPGVTEFQLDGNQGDKWFKGDIAIEKLDPRFKIVISAKRLRSHASDIAIDDVRLFDCSELTVDNTTDDFNDTISSPTEMTTTIPTPTVESFTTVSTTNVPITTSIRTTTTAATARRTTTQKTTTHRPTTSPTTYKPTTTTLNTPVVRSSKTYTANLMTTRKAIVRTTENPMARTTRKPIKRTTGKPRVVTTRIPIKRTTELTTKRSTITRTTIRRATRRRTTVSPIRRSTRKRTTVRRTTRKRTTMPPTPSTTKPTTLKQTTKPTKRPTTPTKTTYTTASTTMSPTPPPPTTTKPPLTTTKSFTTTFPNTPPRYTTRKSPTAISSHMPTTTRRLQTTRTPTTQKVRKTYKPTAAVTSRYPKSTKYRTYRSYKTAAPTYWRTQTVQPSQHFTNYREKTSQKYRTTQKPYTPSTSRNVFETPQTRKQPSVAEIQATSSANHNWVAIGVGVGCGALFGVAVVVVLVCYWNRKTRYRRHDSIEETRMISSIGISSTSLNFELQEESDVTDSPDNPELGDTDIALLG